MTVYLDRLLSERTSLTEIMQGLSERAATEERDLTEPERSEITRLQERCAALDTQLSEHEQHSASARAFADLQARIEAGRAETNGANGHAVQTRQPAPMEHTGFGQRFIESDAFRSYSGHGASQRLTVEDFLETRAAITTANLAIPAYVLPPGEQVSRTPLLGVLNRVSVSSGVVEWVEIGPDPVAAVVAEGALKPEATLTFTPATSSLDTIAHWIQITRQALADASYMRSLVEGKLRRGLLAKVEADAIALLTASTAIQEASGADLMAGIRTGIGMVEAAGYSPNAVVLNPADYAELDIQLMTVTGDPNRRNSFWGLTPVSSTGVTAGTSYVGDFTEGMTLFDRNATDVFVSDSHADLFIRNILVILAEARVKTAITDPLAIAEVTVTAPV